MKISTDMTLGDEMTATLKPEIKKLWIDALLSDEYEQGERHLNINGRFCCLGVLCDLAVKAGVDIVVDDNDGLVSYDTEIATLPASVDRWAMSEGSLGEVGNIFEDGSETLTHLNDAGQRFAVIARVIDGAF